MHSSLEQCSCTYTETAARADIFTLMAAMSSYFTVLYSNSQRSVYFQNANNQQRPMSSTHTNLSLLFGVAFVSLATGFYLGQTIPQLSSKPAKKTAPDAPQEESDEEYSEDESDYEINSLALNDVPGEVKMALVVRQDLKMEKGKIAAQCAHAALGCYRLIATDPSKQSYNPVMTERWLHGGQAKIALKCKDKEMMDELYAKALSMDVNACVIHDAGRTQIAAGSATVVGIGPAPKAVLDQITGDLKLL